MSLLAGHAPATIPGARFMDPNVLARIGNLELVSRAVVQSEFRVAADLVDRVGGGGGPGGLKAVAPTGTESVAIVIPAEAEQVSILGEKLDVIRIDGLDNFSAPGRPIAIVSNLMVSYTPPPPARPARRR